MAIADEKYTLRTDPSGLLDDYFNFQNSKLDYSTGGKGDPEPDYALLYHALGHKDIETIPGSGKIHKSSTKRAQQKLYNEIVNDPAKLQAAISQLKLDSPEFQNEYNTFYEKGSPTYRYFHQGSAYDTSEPRSWDYNAEPSKKEDSNIDDPSYKYSTKTGQLNPAYKPPATQNTPIFSDPNAKPTGLNTITGTLNLGSSGDQVKELQKYLSGIGFKNADGTPLKVDGIYGPNTKTAVMQFQSQNGLQSDGIFGPKSLAAVKTISSTGTQAGTMKAPDDPSYAYNTSTGKPNPKYTGNINSSSGNNTSTNNSGTTTFNTGNPQNDAALQALQSWIEDQQAAGLKLNAALNFDQNTLDRFLETAKKQIHPYYASQIDTIKQDVLRAAPQILQNYDRDIAGAESKFQNQLGGARESYAENGLAFSGQRGKGELGMQSEQNRNLQALSQGYGNDIYNLGRKAESQIGAGNVNYDLGALRNYSANISGNGGFSSGSLYNPYTKGGYGTGSLEYEREAETEAQRQRLLTTASNSVVAGRSYQDLFQ